MHDANVHSGCTVTKPATSSVVSVCTDCTTAAPVPEHESETVVAPVPATTPAEEPAHETPVAPVPEVPAAPYPSSNGTTPIVAPAPSGTGAPTESTSEAAPFEGAASMISASGAGLLAIFGLVAAL